MAKIKSTSGRSLPPKKMLITCEDLDVQAGRSAGGDLRRARTCLVMVDASHWWPIMIFIVCGELIRPKLNT